MVTSRGKWGNLLAFLVEKEIANFED